MDIEKVVTAIPQMNRDDRRRLRQNAEKMLASRNAANAQRVLNALDAQERADEDAHSMRLKGQSIPDRVENAFKCEPLTESELKVVQVLLDNPGFTSEELSRSLGWGGQAWHMKFGAICKRREHNLWPAEPAIVRPADFYSGLLADLSSENRWSIKPAVAEGLARLGIRVARQVRFDTLRSEGRS